MRFVVCVIAAVLIGIVGLAGAVPIEYYATKYEHIDIDTIINNRRMVNYYAACMLSKGPCPPEGLEFKRILPEALQTNCAKCTDKQKTVILRAIKRLRKEYPKVWAQLAALWDPDGRHFDKFVATYGKGSQSEYAAPTGYDSSSSSISNSIDSDVEANNVIKNTIPTSIAPTTTTTSPTTIRTQPTQTTTQLTPSSTIINIFNRINIPTTNSPTNIYTTKTSTNTRPTATVGVYKPPTVSLPGTNIVTDLVRGLGDIGTRVVETGAQLAEVVLKGVQRVVRQF